MLLPFHAPVGPSHFPPSFAALRSLREACAEIGVTDIPTVGPAERQEEVVFDDGRDNLLLSRDSQALFVLTRLRDDAHRFAITYHRQNRGGGEMTHSPALPCLPGPGR